MAPSLNLPPPANPSEDDEASALPLPPAKPKFASGGIIFPPPDIRTTVDKTADFVARVGPSFEAKIRSAESNNPKFSFLQPDDPYHQYYQHRIQAAKNGETTATPPPPAGSTQPEAGPSNGDPAQQGEKHDQREVQGPEQPEPFQFSADLPNITAIDLDIIKLTALFTARKGRSFASALQAREARSFQFEFLRPSHSLYGYFNRLVEQYQKVMQPPVELLEHVKLGAYGTSQASSNKVVTGAGSGGARPRLLEEAKKRAEFEKWASERRKKADELEKQQQAAFNEIDWQDFVVVGTVELTDADHHVDLPPPRSLREVENMTIAQKRMAAMIMETEGGLAEEQVEELDMPGSSRRTATAPAVKKAEDEDMEMEMDNSGDEGQGEGEGQDDGEAKVDIKPSPAPAVEEIKRADGQAPMKIKKDYVPRGIAGRQPKGPQMTQCPVCGEQIAVDEMAEHVRFELLNPKYREQRAELEAKKAQQAALQAGADPTHFLRQFASSRTDIFGTETEEAARARREAEERRLAKEKEKIIWDGHARSRDTAKDMYQKNRELEDQMNLLHRKPAKAPAPSYGPQIPVNDGSEAESSTPLPLPPPGSSLPPRPILAGEAPSAPAAAAAATSASSMHPSRLAALGGASPEPSPALAGQKRPASDSPAGQPPPQRPALDASEPLTKPADGTLHPESLWLSAHPSPVTIQVLLPEATSTCAALDGATHRFEIAPTAAMVSVRDWVHAVLLQTQVGASRLKLRIGNKPVTLKSTAASWNLEDGDVVEVVLGK